MSGHQRLGVIGRDMPAMETNACLAKTAGNLCGKLIHRECYIEEALGYLVSYCCIVSVSILEHWPEVAERMWRIVFLLYCYHFDGQFEVDSGKANQVVEMREFANSIYRGGVGALRL